MRVEDLLLLEEGDLLLPAWGGVDFAIHAWGGVGWSGVDFEPL